MHAFVKRFASQKRKKSHPPPSDRRMSSSRQIVQDKKDTDIKDKILKRTMSQVLTGSSSAEDLPRTEPSPPVSSQPTSTTTRVQSEPPELYIRNTYPLALQAFYAMSFCVSAVPYLMLVTGSFVLFRLGVLKDRPSRDRRP